MDARPLPVRPSHGANLQVLPRLYCTAHAATSWLLALLLQRRQPVAPCAARCSSPQRGRLMDGRAELSSGKSADLGSAAGGAVPHGNASVDHLPDL